MIETDLGFQPQSDQLLRVKAGLLLSSMTRMQRKKPSQKLPLPAQLNGGTLRSRPVSMTPRPVRLSSSSSGFQKKT